MCLRPACPSESAARSEEAKKLHEQLFTSSTPVPERISALQGVVEFVEALNAAAEPFTVPLVPAILQSLADKVRH